ncbi:MAG: DUF6062 family protein [Eubacteriales bacterium]|nr:DUF6062 family protein [Eubacteriales bacterium]MDD4422890.1 DUF6062 family protein [Eubacteriales bacterium]
MQEKIYTIPVNEAFEQSGDECPFCFLYKKLEKIELDAILGAAMMEPDIRIMTNKKGFCVNHYEKMFAYKNRLSLALMLESHIAELAKELKTGGFLSKDIGSKPAERIEKLEHSCYICEQIDEKFSKMVSTAVYLYEKEPEFLKMFNSKKVICLPHYKRLLRTANNSMGKKQYELFVKDTDKIISGYISQLSEDVSWFCKKFDYRYEKEPWNNSKDAVERAIKFLGGPSDID